MTHEGEGGGGGGSKGKYKDIKTRGPTTNADDDADNEQKRVDFVIKSS